MTTIDLNTRINNEIDRLKKRGGTFCPAELGKKFGVSAKAITQKIRDRDDVYRIQKAHARRFSETTISQSIEPEYYPSIWGFREVPA